MPRRKKEEANVTTLDETPKVAAKEAPKEPDAPPPGMAWFEAPDGTLQLDSDKKTTSWYIPSDGRRPHWINRRR